MREEGEQKGNGVLKCRTRTKKGNGKETSRIEGGKKRVEEKEGGGG